MMIPGILAIQSLVFPATVGRIWNIESGSISTGVWTSVCGGDGSEGVGFVGVGSDGEAFLYTEGGGYESLTVPTSSAWSCVEMVYTSSSGNVFLACATGGELMACASSDYTSWSSKTPSTSGSWTSIARNYNYEDIVVVVGSDGSVMTSEDTDSWTTRTAASASPWTSVSHCFYSTYVAVASNGDVMTSSDGITWTSRTAASASPWTSVCYSNTSNLAIAVASNGDIMTSPDGINWTSRTSPISAPFVGVSSTEDAFSGTNIIVAVASDGSAVYSVDGINWVEASTPGTQPWTSVSKLSYGVSEFYAVASDGSVMKTP